MSSATSSSTTSFQLLAIPKALQVGGDGRVQTLRFGLLRTQCGGEPLHLLLERLAVVLLCLCAYVASGCQDVALRHDLLGRGGLTESGDVVVRAGILLTPPGVVGRRNLCDLFVSEITMNPIN